MIEKSNVINIKITHEEITRMNRHLPVHKVSDFEAVFCYNDNVR